MLIVTNVLVVIVKEREREKKKNKQKKPILDPEHSDSVKVRREQ